MIRQREAKRGSSKTEAQDKALNLLRVRYVNILILPMSIGLEHGNICMCSRIHSF
jgi:hypothetical protein